MTDFDHPSHIWWLLLFPALENLPFCVLFHCPSSSRKDYPEFSSSGFSWTLFSQEKNNPALRRELRTTEVCARLSGGRYLLHQNHLIGVDALLCTVVGGGTFHDSDGLLGVGRRLKCWQRHVCQVLGEHISQVKHCENWKRHVADGKRRWQPAYSDSIWSWSGYHRGLNFPPYTGFSSPRGCVSLIIISSPFGMKLKEIQL